MVVSVVVVAAGAAAESAAGAIVASAAGVVVSVVVVSVVAGVASTVVDSVVFDSHEVRPAVIAKARAAALNRLFILGVSLKKGLTKKRPLSGVS